MSASVEVRRLTTPQDLFQGAAEEVIRAANAAIGGRGRFAIALSGGSTPKSLYNLIAANASASLPWEKIFFFWSDERHVSPTDAESNYRMAQETLLAKVPVPAAMGKHHGRPLTVLADAACVIAAMWSSLNDRRNAEPRWPDVPKETCCPGSAGLG